MSNHRSRGVINIPAAIYDLIVRRWVTHGEEQRLREMTANLAGIAAGETVLDVGCGTGTMALVAKRRVGDSGRVVGIDPSRRLLAGARRKAARAALTVDFREASIEMLEFPDKSFDVAMGSFMIHHLPDQVAYKGLAELHRVLKPGGRLLLIDFVRTEQDTAKPEKFGEGTIGVNDLAPLLEAAGFTRIEQGNIQIPIRSIARSHSDYGYVQATKAATNVT
jgi:ubiquinone/menaquinone biosynthesis C-methylase UbiE